ncbi:FxDxF family PEP-CTERM protein [Roseateles sp.]|uniref:FxDxF family PEP-CTERM protein n=1 Tax=Roseateles sp. TaxID=1971397 RepID=UPI002E02ECED|nr:FxDxF family PEP-CTERM protein [Roseateles sp.]
MKLKNIAAASVVAFTALSSHAASTNWGSHDALELGGNTVTSGAIFDTYSFSLASTSSVTSGVMSFGNIVGGAYSLYSFGADGMMGTGDDVGLGAWTFGGMPTTHTVSLTSGNYYYSVLGGVTGSASYAIASTATTAPVPEPETYALLGAGLGVIGFVASRRRRES